MVYISYLMQQVEKKLNIHTWGNYIGDERMDSVEFLDKGGDRQEHKDMVLYIGYYQHRIKEKTSGCTLCLETPENLPRDDWETNCLYLSDPIDIFQLFNTIQGIIYRSHYINNKKEELFLALQYGGGVQGIINIAYTFLNNPITVCDTSFSLIASCPEDENTFDLEVKNGKKYLKLSSLKTMREEKVIERIFHSKLPFFFKREAFDYDWLFCAVRIHQAVVGYIAVRGIERTITEYDVEFLDSLSKMISVEMQKNDFFQNRRGLKYEYFLTDLIEQSFDNEEYVRQRLIQLDRKFQNYFWVLVCDFYSEKNNQIGSGYYVDQLHSILPHSMTMFYNGKLIALMTKENSCLFTTNEQQKLDDFLKFNQMRMAVSYVYTSILDTCYYYKQTLSLLSMKQKAAVNQSLLFYEDWQMEHLLTSIKGQTPMWIMVHPHIKELMEYDTKNHTEYLHTLQTYLENDRNAVKSAACLHIHKSTFFYRITKITNLLSISIDDCKKMYAYELSFKILEYTKTYSI